MLFNKERLIKLLSAVSMWWSPEFREAIVDEYFRKLKPYTVMKTDLSRFLTWAAYALNEMDYNNMLVDLIAPEDYFEVVFSARNKVAVTVLDSESYRKLRRVFLIEAGRSVVARFSTMTEEEFDALY